MTNRDAVILAEILACGKQEKCAVVHPFLTGKDLRERETPCTPTVTRTAVQLPPAMRCIPV